MPTLGPFEFAIVLVIFFIFFGAGKLGQVGGAVRRGVTLFKQNAGIGEADKKDDGPSQKA